MSVPFWLDEPYEARPPLDGRLEVDACVIGAGVGGLSCALHLSGHGVDVAVLERATVASGASGRNGGFLIAGAAPFHNDARELYGRERASRIYAATLEAQEEIIGLAGELGAGEIVRRVGLLRASASEEEADHVREHAEMLAEDGFPGELVERGDLPPGVAYAHNAVFTPHDAALQPARWYRLLASAAERAGARIFEGTPVECPVPAPGEGPLRTAGGAEVSARSVVVAADGALPALVPDYAGRVRSRRLHMVATEPVAERLVEPLVYSRWGYEYWQQRPDGRILGGGFSDVDGETSYTDSDAGSDELWSRIESFIRDDIGAETRVTHRWAGVVGYSTDRLPSVGEVPGRPGLYVMGGYSGTGNVPGFMSGRDVADTIAGVNERKPLFGSDPGPGPG